MGSYTSFDEIKNGFHYGLIYKNKKEEIEAIVSYTSLGIKRNQKCLLILDDEVEEKTYELDSNGIKKLISTHLKKEKTEKEKKRLKEIFRAAIQKKQLQFKNKKEIYQDNKDIDKENVIKKLRREINKALEKGYSGLFIAIELTWFLRESKNKKELFDYERELNQFFQDNKITLLCLYTEKWFPEHCLVNAIKTHPYLVIDNKIHKNNYYLPPELYEVQEKEKIHKNHHKKIINDIKNQKK